MQKARTHSPEVSRKRLRGWNIGASFFSKSPVNRTLPMVSMCINGKKHTALVDTGCTQTLVCKLCCQTWERKEVLMLTVDESSLTCCGESVVWIGIGNEPPVTVRTLVVDRLLLGLDAITQLSEMVMSGSSEVRFPQHGTLICAAITLDEPEFHAEYDEDKRIWTASWKWSGDQLLVSLKNRLSEYPTLKQLQGEYEQELLRFRMAGWFWTQRTNLDLLKAWYCKWRLCRRTNKRFIPSCYYHELNEHIDAYTAGVDICVYKLREWWFQGSDVAVLDLHQAYLQIHIERSLWPFRPWNSRGPDTASANWNLVSMRLLTSWQQSWLQSECRTRTFKKQHHPTLMTSSSMNILCLPSQSKNILSISGWHARSQSLSKMGWKC